MKTIKVSIVVAAIYYAVLSMQAQQFVNLDFSSAQLSAYGAGPAFVPITDALPGWTGYLGTSQQTAVVYNTLAIGSANLAILNTNSVFAGVIPGNKYTVVLQAGLGDSGYDVSASIAQTAMIPANTEDILFTASFPSTSLTAGWQVTIDGQIIPVTQISTVGSDYGVYEGDVSAFAGQVDDLELTALAGSGPTVNLYLDSISFSSVPEPGEFALTALGALLLGCRCWRN